MSIDESLDQDFGGVLRQASNKRMQLVTKGYKNLLEVLTSNKEFLASPYVAPQATVGTLTT